MTKGRACATYIEEEADSQDQHWAARKSLDQGKCDPEACILEGLQVCKFLKQKERSK